MENNSSLAPVLLVVGLAFLVPLILSRFKRLRLPVVVGEIIAGMIIGRSGLQLVESDPTLEVLAALGFAFLMFLSGAEIDFSMLAPNARGNRSNQGNPLMLGLLILALTILLASAVGIVLANQGLVRSPWLMGLILSTTSLGIVVPVLREQGLSSTRYGQTLLLSALTADFVTMVLITVVVAVLSGGLTLQVMLVGVLLLAFLLAVRFARRITRWPPIRCMLDEVSHTTVQIKVRGALAVDVRLRGVVAGAGRRGDPGGLPGRRADCVDLYPGRYRGAADDEFNLRVCRAARSVFGAEHIIAAVQDVTRAHEFEAAGARVVNPSLASATVIDGLLRYPDMFTLMSNVEDGKELVEIAMGNPDLHGRSCARCTCRATS